MVCLLKLEFSQHTKQTFTVLKNKREGSYFLINDVVYDQAYFSRLYNTDQHNFLIEGIVARTHLMSLAIILATTHQ